MLSVIVLRGFKLVCAKGACLWHKEVAEKNAARVALKYEFPAAQHSSYEIL